MLNKDNVKKLRGILRALTGSLLPTFNLMWQNDLKSMSKSNLPWASYNSFENIDTTKNRYTKLPETEDLTDYSLYLSLLNGITSDNNNSGLTNSINAVSDLISNMLPPLYRIFAEAGKLAGNLLSKAGVKTDLMTTFDKIAESTPFKLPLFWNSFGKKSDTFNYDPNSYSNIGGSYMGMSNFLNQTSGLSNKKFGLVSNRARKKTNRKINLANTYLGELLEEAKETQDTFDKAYSVSQLNTNRYNTLLNGGFDSRVFRVKNGIKLDKPFVPNIEPAFKPIIVERYKNGGKTDIPKTEETTLKNVIPEGALHKNKHHMEVDDNITKKGIPVIDNSGELLAEIELNEIIFTLEVTKKLEELYKENTDEAAIEAGKLLVNEILFNTDDRTNLINTLKNGGTINDAS